MPKGNATKEFIESLQLKPGQVVYKCPKCCSIKPDRAHHCRYARARAPPHTAPPGGLQQLTPNVPALGASGHPSLPPSPRGPPGFGLGSAHLSHACGSAACDHPHQGARANGVPLEGSTFPNPYSRRLLLSLLHSVVTFARAREAQL